MYNYLERFKK